MSQMLHRTALALILFVAALSAAADDWRWEGVGRVVAVGDIHGAYDEVTGILRRAGLIDEQLRWTGGDAHLVSMGDLVDRGPRSRSVLELFMALQPAAAQAGGRVHVLLANHEAMQLAGELDYVSAEEFASYADVEDPARRESAYRRFLQRGGLEDGAAARTDFDARFPLGYFGHQAMFEPDGRYGAWILQRPAAIVINGSLFVHGGVSDDLAGGDLAALNARLSGDLAAYASAWSELRDAGVLNESDPFSERPTIAAAATAQDPALAAAVAQLTASSESPVFTAEGPLWFRGTAWCNENFEIFRVDRVLRALGAERAVLGHTPTRDSLIVSRMDGAVLLIDTGMLEPVYHGRPSALLDQNGTLAALYSETPQPIEMEARRVGPRPDLLTDEQLEDILRNGEIVSIEDVGQGVTKPRKVKLRRDGVEVQAVFKTESTPIEASRRSQQTRLINLSDRWEHEVAAYRLDRLIGLRMVPVSVEREIGGQRGSMQYWIDGLISELRREQESIPATGWCSLSEQWPLMFLFDALIYNEDRTKQNITYSRDEWMLYLIDHSRAFRTLSGRPKDLRKVDLKLSRLLAARLEALDFGQLNGAMGKLLDKAQIQALLKRRDQILRQASRTP